MFIDKEKTDMCESIRVIIYFVLHPLLLGLPG